MRLNLTALIELLEAVNSQETLAEQTATLELALTSLQLNPNPIPLYEAGRALAALQDLDLETLGWLGVDDCETNSELDAYWP